jgi:iron complex outermembrane receptor protein
LHTNPSAFNREFTDLKQIEILKGPQGAIYGRSASSGAIIVTTNDPSEEFTGSVKLRGGSQDTYFVSAAASGPIVADQLFGRIHVDYRETDGFFKNNFQNNEKIVDDFENWNVSGRVLWQVNDDLKFDFKGHYGEVDAAAISFNAAFALADAAGGVPGPLYEDVNDHDFLFQANINPSNE